MSHGPSNRLDRTLVSRGLAPSRSQALLLIQEGSVLVNGHPELKASTSVSEHDRIEIQKKEIYVGRGGHKLAAAMEYFQSNPQDLIVADIGASTGGFTDYVLQHGALRVYAIDVGHGQLAEKLKNDPRVINMEGTNIRELEVLPEKVDLCVVDLSFISLRLVLENIFHLVKEGGRIITLVKPQFEGGKNRLGKGGVIRDTEIHKQIILELYDWCTENHFSVMGFIPSPVLGKEGNKEFFFYFHLLFPSNGYHKSIARSDIEKFFDPQP